MTKNRTDFRSSLSFLFFASAVFLLSFTWLQDTDGWMHLSYGKEIFRQGGLPKTEPFAYPSLGRPFTYTSWLFAVLYYMSYAALGLTGVVMLKAVTVTAAFAVLFRDAMRPYRDHVVALVVLSLVVIMARHRFVERPDTALMLCMAFTVFSLNAYLYEGKKYLYSLPIVYLIWANCHSSINLSFIPFLAFIGGGLLQRLLSEKKISGCFAPPPERLKTMAWIWLLSSGATLLNPNGLGQYTYGISVIGSAWWKQEILELRQPGWPVIKWLYAMTGITAVSFVINGRRLSIVHLLLVAPFTVLPFLSIRFVFLPGIVAGPVVARNISQWLHERGRTALLETSAATFSALIWTATSAALLFTDTVSFMDIKKNFGVGADYSSVPEGALSYMDKASIYGRVFNYFGWGGYIDFRDFPKRSVFVDPRGYLTDDLLEMHSAALDRTAVLDGLQKRFGFESLLVSYPVLPDDGAAVEAVEDAALRHPFWALVYWDDVSLLYLKRDGRYADLIIRDEYRSVKPANGPSGLVSRLKNPAYLDAAEEELRRNIALTGSAKAHLLLGTLLNESGRYRGAAEAFDTALKKGLTDREKALAGLGRAFYRLGMFRESAEQFGKASSEAGKAELYYEEALALIGSGDKRSAASRLKQAVRVDPAFEEAYPPLISIYRELGEPKLADEATVRHGSAKKKKQAAVHFNNGLRAYSRGDAAAAISEFSEAARLDPSSPAAYSNMGFVYYDIGMLDEAAAWHAKAVETDPKHANAHYGLAQISKKRGDLKETKRHLEDYLKAAPVGEYSRKAMGEIAAIEKNR